MEAGECNMLPVWPIRCHQDAPGTHKRTRYQLTDMPRGANSNLLTAYSQLTRALYNGSNH